MDDIKVARPVLEHSIALTDNDLIDVAGTQSQEHLLAVTRRSNIAERVSEALVSHGEDRVVASLLVNKGAQIARETYERVAERAQESPILHEPFVRRQGVPLDLLNDLYVSVAAELRQEILKTYENVSAAELDMALARSRKRVAKAYGGLPADFEQSQLELRKLQRNGAQSRTLFLLAFASLTESDYYIVRRLVESRDIDALALICRAAGFERTVFVGLARLVVAEKATREQLDEFGKLYEQVPVMAAQRAVRFWKVREAA